MSMSGVFQWRLTWKDHQMTMMSGYVPTTPEQEREEAMPSDLGARKEVIPQEPESDF